MVRRAGPVAPPAHAAVQLTPGVGMTEGRRLFEEVRSCSSAAGFWRLRQATFIVKWGGSVVLVDPFLSPAEGRLFPPLFQAEDASGIVDVVARTHDHVDHIDPLAVASGLARHTGASFVALRAHAARMRGLGVPAECSWPSMAGTPGGTPRASSAT